MTDGSSLDELGERLERLDAPIRIWREQRDRAFDAAFEAHRLLEDYLAYASRILKQGGRPEWLERGVAAASIDDQRRDYRDWLMSLGDLYLSARAAHLDPAPVLKRIAELSNPERHAAAPTATRDALARFEDSAYFATSILPQLR